MIDCTAMAMERILADIKHLQFKEEANLQRYRADLLRAISHDLRTPLSGIMGSCEMLVSLLDANSKEYALTKDIYEDSQWLYTLVENILSLTKLQEGKMLLNWQFETLDEIIGTAVTVFERRYGIDVQVSLPQQIVIVKVDAKLIEQVIINLLDNAKKHSESTDIRIYAQICDNIIDINVEDFGKGIDDDEINKIFDMFYTGGKKHADAKTGIGLGLTIAKSIVEAHGGTIKAKNKTSGSGAVFTIALPIEKIEE